MKRNVATVTLLALVVVVSYLLGLDVFLLHVLEYGFVIPALHDIVLRAFQKE